MTEQRFGNSHITCTPGCDEPFEITLGASYYGNQQLSAIEAKQIADFIYESLGLNENENMIQLPKPIMNEVYEKEINDAWDNFQKIREKHLSKQDDLLIDILTGKIK